MLAYESAPGVWSLWTGEPVAGVIHPLSVADLWTDEALFDIGLRRILPAEPPPAGQRHVGVPSYVPAGAAVQTVYATEPEPPPPTISDRQFAHELRARGIITQAEALAFVGQGVMPAALAAILAALPTQAARDDAELIVTGATVLERAHPLTGAIGTAFGWDDAAIDDFFRAAAAR